MSRYQNAGQKHRIKMANRPFEDVAEDVTEVFVYIFEKNFI
jgi:hypothetical protein